MFFLYDYPVIIILIDCFVLTLFTTLTYYVWISKLKDIILRHYAKS